jgi:hypothetical protein
VVYAIKSANSLDDEFEKEDDRFQFLALPHDPQLEVIDHLDFPSTHNLRTTSHRFRDLIKVPTHEKLIEVEWTEWAQDCLCSSSPFTYVTCYSEFNVGRSPLPLFSCKASHVL